MSGDAPFQGSLFASDFLAEHIAGLEEWKEIDDAVLDDLEVFLRSVFEHFPTDGFPNESQTETDLIWPVLMGLGWKANLRQQNLSTHGRTDVPDGLLFSDNAAKNRANAFHEEWRRYELGLAIVESKRWKRPLDRQSGRRGEETAPSTQMLRYLRRVDDLTTGNLRWGILTNGARWRLYFSGARSVSEQFFEIDLGALVQRPEERQDLFALSKLERRHWLKVFALVFRREAFLPGVADSRTLHQRAIEEGRYYEQRVASDLSDLVFNRVFPELAHAIAEAEPAAPLEDVREAALILLYRLLFILYAEDRDLLPVRDERYDDYGLREKVRGDIGRRKDLGDVFSSSLAHYWPSMSELCRAINEGDASIGLPPYNGGLFDPARAPLLDNIRLSDAVMAEAIDLLSFERTPEGRRYINYRDLGVQQLGSIYERLLEHEIVPGTEGDGIVVRPNIFARKTSGSYYTPDDLVGLIIDETIEPLVHSCMDAFSQRVSELASSQLTEDRRMGRLKSSDPAEKLLELRICDPAIGSGHFLVNLVDYVADRVIEAMAEAEAAVEDYISPLTERIQQIRSTIIANAEKRGWAVDEEQLDDRHIIKRMVLKRCIYGVDKNPMAVELAKVSLWLHTFTVGAPLSFLDHHIRCGDSLFGAWVRAGIDRAGEQGASLFLEGPLNRATRAAAPMQILEGLTDAEIAEAHRSAEIFAEVDQMTAPLNAFLSLVHAFEWLNLRRREDRAAVLSYFLGLHGDPINIASDAAKVCTETEEGKRFADLLKQARELILQERFFNWEVAFPGVWHSWEERGRHGGFDAVIGNPPWDRIKLQQVEWFAARRPEIAGAPRAADRKRMIAEMQDAGDPLAGEYEHAAERAKAAARMARDCGDYPLLSRGDINLYSLFVERAMTLVKPAGMVGLLTPSGIASDKTAAHFFKSVATEGRLKTIFDFENKKVFFRDIHASFKFCVFVASSTRVQGPAKCAFFLHSTAELHDKDRCFPLTPQDFAKVNPNTGTAPIFRSRRDAELTTAIYGRLPILVNRSSGEEVRAWPVKYKTMFHMTNDSGFFRTREELEEQEGAYPIGGNRYRSPSGDWVPLFEGKMVQAYDHRAASVVVDSTRRHRPAQPVPAALEQHQDPDWLPDPQYWVPLSKCQGIDGLNWVLGFKEITAPTNVRTFIAALLPAAGFGNKIPVLLPRSTNRDEWLLVANLNATILDFVTRQKVHGQTLNLFMVEQLPVAPREIFDRVRFGPKTAGEIIREAVLELTYTSSDMAPLACHLGYVDSAGNAKKPFIWDEKRRLLLRAKVDAVFFHLYGITKRDDVHYIFSTFPIVHREEIAAYGRYCSRDICMAYMNALAAGDPDAQIDL